MSKNLFGKSQELANQISNLNKTLDSSTKTINAKNQELSTQIVDAKHNQDKLIPIGFIYSQLPDQTDPKSIWPKYTWSDVTSSYAGLFFRAEGGGSERFGSLQADNSPRLTSVTHYWDDHGYADGTINMVLGDSSKHLIITQDGRGAENTIGFGMSGGEVRPVNKAFKIWKRTG